MTGDSVAQGRDDVDVADRAAITHQIQWGALSAAVNGLICKMTKFLQRNGRPKKGRPDTDQAAMTLTLI